MLNEVDGETCRFCGTQEGFRVFIFDQGSDHIKKIKSILPMEVSEEDTLPKFMCYRCTYKLKESYAFQQQCLRMDAVLRGKLGLPSSQSGVNLLQSTEGEQGRDTSARPSEHAAARTQASSPADRSRSGPRKKRSPHKRKWAKGTPGTLADSRKGGKPSEENGASSAGQEALPASIVVTRIPGSCCIYTCQACDRCFVSEGAAVQHGCGPAAPSDVHEYVCDHCSKTFTRYVSLLAHQEAHLRSFAEEEDVCDAKKPRKHVLSSSEEEEPSTAAV
ncbi:uncharacterized protein LOC134542566 [Bacillus rossius redtenbacheri]|uniref:uncharacterized protein LOC134542566 n=1 Tax=Bacillus rossius redtenbacheri TaxID=93214 RepID=UPI002FDEB8EC